MRQLPDLKKLSVPEKDELILCQYQLIQTLEKKITTLEEKIHHLEDRLSKHSGQVNRGTGRSTCSVRFESKERNGLPQSISVIASGPYA